jgi:hypothetical protein
MELPVIQSCFGRICGPRAGRGTGKGSKEGELFLDAKIGAASMLVIHAAPKRYKNRRNYKAIGWLVLQPPLPLQEFLPLQPLSPVLQPPWPLQEFMPLQSCLAMDMSVEEALVVLIPGWALLSC